MSVTILIGDVREQLRTLADNSIHCCVTSPPYWGLRDYGVEGQIGLEQSPAEFIAVMVDVFEEVRRVLRADGTCFINMGDSYFSSSQRAAPCGTSGKELASSPARDCLCGSLCDACRKAYRIGKSHSDSQRAPKLDSLQSGSNPSRMESERGRLPTLDYQPLVVRTSTSIPDRMLTPELSVGGPLGAQVSTSPESSSQPAGSCLQGSSPGEVCLSCGHSLQGFVRESAHMEECSLCTSSRGSAFGISGRGILDSAYPYSTTASLKPKDLCMMPHRLAIALQDAGWWVRQDIVWSKPNPMPESVRDRCTKSHEYIFLLTKSARYYYDAEAIKEPVVGDPDASRNRFDTKDYDVPGQKPQKRLSRGVGFGHGTDADQRERGRVARKDLPDTQANLAQYRDRQRENAAMIDPAASARLGRGPGWRQNADIPSTRNKRSVWTIATHSFAEAHFATFPPELPEICIKAGTSEAGHCPECGNRWARVIERTPMVIAKTDRNDDRGTRTGTSGTMVSPASSTTTGWAPTCACRCDPVPDIVLDPFFGAGTSGLVADRLQRDCIGIELNPAYAEIARKRIQGESPLFAEVASTAPKPMKQEQAIFAEVP